MSLSDYFMLSAYSQLEPLPLAKMDLLNASTVQSILSIFNPDIRYKDCLNTWALIGVDANPAPKTDEEKKHLAITRIMEFTGGALSYDEIKAKIEARDAKLKQEIEKCQTAQAQK